MPKFPIDLSDELHKELKKKAIDSGKSLHQYILDCIQNSPQEYTPIKGAINVGINAKGEIKKRPKESKHAMNCKCYTCKK